MAPTDRLLNHFESLEDPRTPYLIEHRLLDIIGLTICAVVCGAESWVEVEAYGQSKAAWLKTFLALPSGIPSHDTISRLFAQLDPDQLQGCFLSWVKSVSALSEGSVVAIDGKTVRQSYDRGRGKGAIHMVSAWAAENRLVLGQVAVDEKSNEITAIPALLKVLALRGCIVTLDAMGTQKAIAQQIIEQEGDYILSLKGNQPGLYEDVQQIFDHARQQGFKAMPHEAYETIEKGHGRIEIRRHWLLGEVEHLVDADQWLGLKRVGLIESERRLPGQAPTITQRYYLTSLDGGVERFAQATRSHWGIENSLHWCLDVAFHEDDCRIRTGYAPQNMVVLRHLALNLLTQESSAKVGKKAKRLKAGWDNDYLFKVLTLTK
ncbi:ISAs1 family transposase [Leptolyngbya sp. BL0902]|uniref:ISAs1 family transposase n=1 Tax=Leptolyngbya sp. BL0902 TaxID=1115757 RepID=UPI0018E8ED21|nr:ISAs1 family transposase [Leptolyngbya sp. BL0902]QQE64471.1 ISAs1 family transposase [Leptolyngbya sp. BL0902]QQE67015.1 ISAs1 family transposase [Leptolyngbya sp. BL0902]